MIKKSDNLRVEHYFSKTMNNLQQQKDKFNRNNTNSTFMSRLIYDQ